MSFIGKTGSFIGLNALRNLVSESLAIDMGSANTIIAVRRRGIVVDQPSVVAVNKINGEVIAVGNEARKMQGREARDVSVIAPLVDGVVADFELTREMLEHFVQEARSGISHVSRRAIMSVLSEMTQVEQRALLAAAEKARISRVYMIEEGQAAAIGAGVPIDDEHAAAVVDIGGGSMLPAPDFESKAFKRTRYASSRRNWRHRRYRRSCGGGFGGDRPDFFCAGRRD